MSINSSNINRATGAESIDEAYTQSKKIGRFVFVYIFIALGFIAIGPRVFTSSWISSSDFHSCIEIVGSFFALIAAGVCLTYFFARKNRFYLIVGLGFFIAGSEDLVHGILSWSRLFEGTGVDFSRFVPGTYVAGRTVLAVMTIAAPFLEQVTKKVVNEKREAYIFSGLAVLLGGGTTILAFLLPLPQLIFPERLISRPVDFISAILFLMAFLSISKRYLAKRDIFSGMLIASILFNLCGQVYMSFSKELYDIFFDVAHWANVFSYTMPILGISVQNLREMERSKIELFKRKQTEEELQKAKDNLEIKVEQRTVELLQANEKLKIEVNERKHAEETLWESRAQVQALLDGSPDMIMQIDTNMKIVWANKTALDINPDAIGQTCHEAYANSDEPCQGCPCKRAVDTGRIEMGVIYQSVIKGVRGESYWENIGVPIKDSGGRIVGAIEIARNVTERKRAEEKQSQLLDEVERTNKELKDFAYIASHDLKAPLRGIKTLAQWISTDYADKLDAEGKEQLDLLIGRTDRMHNLIEGIMEYSRVGRIKEKKVRVNLNELVLEVIDMVAPPENITITVEDELPVLECGKTRITQVFQNLLSNAVKYMDKPEGRIRIDCAEEDGFWRFSVADNGCGIEEKHFEKIFRMFQTLLPRDEFESTGVGLSVVKKIVELYNGKIWVESQPGEGSTFFFTLPKQEMGVKNEELEADIARRR